MIAVDSSAIVAIMRGEADGSILTDVLDRTRKSFMSVVSYVETNMVIVGRRPDAGSKEIDALLQALHIDVVPVTLDQGSAALAAFMNYGKGRHKAALNIADCFAYGLAKSRDIPLLFKGDDFRQTDIVPAWQP